MLRLSKKVEYGILAAQFMARKYDEHVSAKEISDSMGLSFDFLSKTLQALLRTGVLTSQKGVKGGYKLARMPEDISLNDIIKSLEEHSTLVECLDSNDEVCSFEDICSIKNPLNIIQNKIDNLFSDTSVAEFLVDIEPFMQQKQNSTLNIDMNKVKNG